MYKLSINDPVYPKGYPIELDSIGIINNGSSVVLSEDEQTVFMARKSYYDDSGVLVCGPDFGEAFKGSAVITVTKVDSTPKLPEVTKPKEGE